VRERAGGEQGGGGFGDQPAGDALAAADGDRGVDLGAVLGGRQVVVDVEPDGTVRGEREPLRLGLMDLDVEADAAAGQAAGDAGAEPVTRRGVSRSSTSNGSGAQRATASGSVSTSRTASGPASTVVVAVQVFMVLNRPTAGRPCRRPGRRSCWDPWTTPCPPRG